MKSRPRPILLLVMSALLGLLWPAPRVLAQDMDAPDDGGNAQRVVREAEQGPVHMLVQVSDAEIEVGQTIALVIEVTAPAGMRVRLPEIDESLGPFRVRRSQTPPDVPLEGALRRWRHEYRLRTFESGEVNLPALEVTWSEDGAAESLGVDAIAIEVRSIVGEAEAAQAFRDVREPIAVVVPRTVNWWLLLWVATALWVLVGLVAAVIVLVVLHRRRKGQAPPLTPGEWALQELEALVASGLLETGQVLPYFERLSDILRQYIERRFGLRAPERTTEEFLREAQQHSTFGPAYQVLLGNVLRAADLVKFALHEPRREDAQRAFDAARSFVLETRQAVEPQHVPVRPDVSRNGAAGGTEAHPETRARIERVAR